MPDGEQGGERSRTGQGKEQFSLKLIPLGALQDTPHLRRCPAQLKGLGSSAPASVSQTPHAALRWGVPSPGFPMKRLFATKDRLSERGQVCEAVAASICSGWGLGVLAVSGDPVWCHQHPLQRSANSQ